MRFYVIVWLHQMLVGLWPSPDRHQSHFTLMPMPPACTCRISVSLPTSKWQYHHWKQRQQQLDRQRVSMVIMCGVTQTESTWGTVLPRASATSCMTCSSGRAPGNICLKRADLGPSGSVSLSYFPASALKSQTDCNMHTYCIPCT